MKKNDSKNTKKDNDIVRCPKCSSTSVTLTQRGYSALFGYIGANRLYHKCQNCGYKWKAGKVR